MDTKIDWNDITLCPATLSDIDHRSDINILDNGKLPLFTAPMDTVVDNDNAELFLKSGINVCVPRGITTKNINIFQSYGLDEIIDIVNKDGHLHNKVLIDIASAHMKKCFNISKKIKEIHGSNVELMVGNIANPETYRRYCEIGVDWIRCGIGAGSVCTTSANVSIHYPMASLILECKEISYEFNNPTKIIADGGFRSFADIIKALALGADAVMLGGVLNKCVESCGINLSANVDKFIKEYDVIDLETAKQYLIENRPVYKLFRGMSTKEVQKSWNRTELRTAEGISKYNEVDYTLDKWLSNFTDYLRSAMSYCNAIDLNSFIGKAEYKIISQNAYSRFNK